MADALTRREEKLPDKYDPAHGLKTIAVAEAAEKHFARAKDPTKLYEAMQTKLGEQRRFVLWWDGQQKNPGGNPSQTSNGLLPSSIATIEKLGLDRETIHRWRKKLKDPHKFDEALEAASARAVRIAEFARGTTEQKGASGTGENEWYTPPEYLAAARDVMGAIDLDPASSDAAQNNVGATNYFTKKDDGLAQEWSGRVWLNPPYAQPHIADFVSKMVAERKARRVTSAIMLTHNYTDTSWFHEAAGIADAICFTRGRVKFYDAKGNIAAPTQGQAFFYFGAETAAFAKRFANIGFVMVPAR